MSAPFETLPADAIARWSSEPASLERTEALSYCYYRASDDRAEKALLKANDDHCDRSSWLTDRRFRIHPMHAGSSRVRPALNTAVTPTDEQHARLQRTIFVTGGDAAFFPWIMECVAAFRSHDCFVEVPVGIIDCGLTDDQKHRLQTEFAPLTIVDPGFDFAERGDMAASWRCGIPEGRRDAFKAITSRAYLDRHFPGHDYYLWCDADAWLQDPAAMLRFVDLAERQTIGMSENNYALLCRDTMFYGEQYMTSAMRGVLRGRKQATCAGVICMTRPFMALWRGLVEELFAAKGVVNNSPSLWYAIHRELQKPAFLAHSDQFFFKREGLPLVDERQALYSPATRQPCGFIHLNGFYDIRDAWRYLPGIAHLEGDPGWGHARRSWKGLEAIAQAGEDPLRQALFARQRPFAFRYALVDPDPDALAQRTVLRRHPELRAEPNR
ncbi:MAG: hypothetical protein ABJF50_07195 [Paracoccaceae bacterium]